MISLVKLAASAVLGIGFFIFPFEQQGKTTVLFDILVKFLTQGFPGPVAWYCFALALLGAMASLLAGRLPILKDFRCSPLLLGVRVIGAVLAFLMLFQLGPKWLINQNVSGLIWNVLVFSVGVIIPVGAIFLNIFISYGLLEFVGTLMRPIMRPLFRLPGRSALDDLTSWLGSYSVGLYMTRKLALQGYYNRRETFIIVTCFSTVSMGFVGVVAATLNLLEVFPLLFATYCFATYFLAMVLVRLPPITRVPQTYITTPRPENEIAGGPVKLVEVAARLAWDRAKNSKSYFWTVKEGLLDGLKLSSTILGSILSVGTAAILIAEYTPVFQILGAPMVPILKLLGLPDAEILAPATLAGIAEMYVPALMVKSAALSGKFFIALLSVSQLIFFSSVGPMMMDMFKEIPITFSQLVFLFFLRTAILIPLLALLVHIYQSMGFLGA